MRFVTNSSSSEKLSNISIDNNTKRVKYTQIGYGVNLNLCILMEHKVGIEICVGLTDRLVNIVKFLELPNTRSIYNAPFEIFCWFWFMAYVVNIKKHHNRTSFRDVHVSTLFKALRANYARFLEVTESYCDAFFTRQLFAVQYSSQKGFYLTTKTTVWRDLICSVTGKCYSMPDAIADTLDKMGFSYFHDNGRTNCIH